MVKFVDTTLRDGSHFVKHQLSVDFIKRYCDMLDSTGIYATIIGHGNGLGASSAQIGISKHTDTEILTAARKRLNKVKLGIYMIPGLGTIEDDLIPAIDIGVDIFKIGCHCSEANTTKQHIIFLSKNAKEVYGCLMMSHMITPQELLFQAKLMEEYGAKGVIVFDSAGAFILDDIRERISLLKNNLKIEIGFHSHNNLGLAIANMLIANTSGASIIDGTLKGFGPGAGNCQLDAIIPIMHKKGILSDLNIDIYKLLDIGDLLIEKELGYQKGISSLSVISGISGVFSAFSVKVKEASIQFRVDGRDIFIELGKRKVVGGQEDIIIDIAMNLAQKQKKDDDVYMMSSLL